MRGREAGGNEEKASERAEYGASQDIVKPSLRHCLKNDAIVVGMCAKITSKCEADGQERLRK
jgi:hypothetical protein